MCPEVFKSISFTPPDTKWKVTDHRVAREILEDTKSEKPALIYQGFNAIFGGGESFFTASGHRWKHVRKSTNQAFAQEEARFGG